MSDDDGLDMLSAEPTSDDLGQAFLSNDSTNPHCVVCGTELTYSGRGPKPKYCDEHRKNKGSSTGVRRPRVGKDMAGLEQQLADFYRFAALGVSMFNMVDGHEIEVNADKLAHSWIVAAETNPKLLKFLQRFTTGSALGGVIAAHVMVAVPIAMNHGIMEKIGRKVNQ